MDFGEVEMLEYQIEANLKMLGSFEPVDPEDILIPVLKENILKENEKLRERIRKLGLIREGKDIEERESKEQREEKTFRFIGNDGIENKRITVPIFNGSDANEKSLLHLRDYLKEKRNPPKFQGGYVDKPEDLSMEHLHMMDSCHWGFWDNPLIESIVQQTEAAIPLDERRNRHLQMIKDTCEKKGKDWRDYEHFATGTIYSIPENFGKYLGDH